MLLINGANLLLQALFDLVTDRASMMAVQSKSGLPILAKCRHVNQKCAKTAGGPPVLLKYSGAH